MNDGDEGYDDRIQWIRRVIRMRLMGWNRYQRQGDV